MLIDIASTTPHRGFSPPTLVPPRWAVAARQGAATRAATAPVLASLDVAVGLLLQRDGANVHDLVRGLGDRAVGQREGGRNLDLGVVEDGPRRPAAPEVVALVSEAL